MMVSLSPRLLEGAPKMLLSLGLLLLAVIFRRDTVALNTDDQVFIQTDKELKFLVDGIPMPLSSADSVDVDDTSFTTHFSNMEDDLQSLAFHPPLLDFGEQSVGMPRMEYVQVQNQNSGTSMRLLSISGSTPHFHCSFFQDKELMPGGNTTFSVVFLARQRGNVENTLYIHTTHGTYHYQVFGRGTASPYRVKPLIGAQIPVNTTFSSIIRLYNPHHQPLKVIEMFSNGGDLHLEMLEGYSRDDSTPWVVAPYQSKPVMRVTLVGRVEANHTLYVRIRTNLTGKDPLSSHILVPVEVEVCSQPGLYALTPTLDYGVLRSVDDPPKSMRILLINTTPRPIHVTRAVLKKPNPAVTMDFRPIILQPSAHKPTQVAVVYFDPSVAEPLMHGAGKILIETKKKEYSLLINYEAEVKKGALGYNKAKTLFFVGEDAPQGNSVRSFNITNTFDDVALIVHNITLPRVAEDLFMVAEYSGQVVIPPGASARLFKLTFKRPDPATAAAEPFSFSIQLHTNLSPFNIPISVYNGKLQIVYHSGRKKELDFGTLGFGETRKLYFAIRNDNPLPVTIKSIRAMGEYAHVDLAGIEEGPGSTLAEPAECSVYDLDDFTLKANHFAVFGVNVTAPREEAMYSVDVKIISEFEMLYVPVRFQTATGSVKCIPDEMHFDVSFPTKVSSQALTIRSSFPSLTEVTQVSFVPGDPRFSFIASEGENAVALQPDMDTVIGWLYFDSRWSCGSQCYVGFPVSTSLERDGGGKAWIDALTLGQGTADIDSFLYALQKQRWDRLVAKNQLSINVTVQIDTNPVSGFLFPAEAQLDWPLLVWEREVVFPPTQIGNLSIEMITVENPSDQNVVIQILCLSIYPHPDTIIDIMDGNRYSSDQSSYFEYEPDGVFSLQNLEEFNKSPDNPVPGYRRYITELFGVRPHKKTVTTILLPGVRVGVQIGFRPKDGHVHSSVVVVRNNLTVVDVLIVRGRGAYGDIALLSQSSTPPTTTANSCGSCPTTTYQRPTRRQHTAINIDVTAKILKDSEAAFRKVEAKAARRSATKKSGEPPKFEAVTPEMGVSMGNNSNGADVSVYYGPDSYHLVRGTYFMKNVGEYPVYIHDVLIDDLKCIGYGFVIAPCGGFSIKPNVSKRFHITYIPEFSTTNVHRDLHIRTSLDRTFKTFPISITFPGGIPGNRFAAQLPRPSFEYWALYIVLIGTPVMVVLIYMYAFSDAETAFRLCLMRHLRERRARAFDLRRVAEHAVDEMADETCSNAGSSGSMGTGIGAGRGSKVHKNLKGGKVANGNHPPTLKDYAAIGAVRRPRSDLPSTQTDKMTKADDKNLCGSSSTCSGGAASLVGANQPDLRQRKTAPTVEGSVEANGGTEIATHANNANNTRAARKKLRKVMSVEVTPSAPPPPVKPAYEIVEAAERANALKNGLSLTGKAKEKKKDPEPSPQTTQKQKGKRESRALSFDEKQATTKGTRPSSAESSYSSSTLSRNQSRQQPTSSKDKPTPSLDLATKRHTVPQLNLSGSEPVFAPESDPSSPVDDSTFTVVGPRGKEKKPVVPLGFFNAGASAKFGKRQLEKASSDSFMGYGHLFGGYSGAALGAVGGAPPSVHPAPTHKMVYHANKPRVSSTVKRSTLNVDAPEFNLKTIKNDCFSDDASNDSDIPLWAAVGAPEITAATPSTATAHDDFSEMSDRTAAFESGRRPPGAIGTKPKDWETRPAAEEVNAFHPVASIADILPVMGSRPSFNHVYPQSSAVHKPPGLPSPRSIQHPTGVSPWTAEGESPNYRPIVLPPPRQPPIGRAPDIPRTPTSPVTPQLTPADIAQWAAANEAATARSLSLVPAWDDVGAENSIKAGRPLQSQVGWERATGWLPAATSPAAPPSWNQSATPTHSLLGSTTRTLPPPQEVLPFQSPRTEIVRSPSAPTADSLWDRTAAASKFWGAPAPKKPDLPPIGSPIVPHDKGWSPAVSKPAPKHPSTLPLSAGSPAYLDSMMGDGPNPKGLEAITGISADAWRRDTNNGFESNGKTADDIWRPGADERRGRAGSERALASPTASLWSNSAMNFSILNDMSRIWGSAKKDEEPAPAAGLTDEEKGSGDGGGSTSEWGHLSGGGGQWSNLSEFHRGSTDKEREDKSNGQQK